ncbi:nucleotidyl transferase AbiEii/AbiGii toxin family protein [Acidisphaera sp. L21]|uniref:nucleotidyl transferase AbiEii/AbiGii toxin family protein n=1 Tax=Acidisphaera sp. L21 TaxID=1641851 RepID=UPI00131DB291|nr:nucleotidyl transferase AbiEii/AbiGii toxin family protein [Acidisphaera sp. L21]
MNGQAQGILNRLRAVAKERGVTTDHALARWTAERFLARLSASEHASRLVLKGAYVFTLWHGDLMRSTLDVDLHGYETDMVRICDILLAVAAASRDDDGLYFVVAEARFKPLVGSRLAGLRLLLPARLGSAHITLKIDLGFGHAITPGPDVLWYPSLLPGFPSFRIHAYPRETVVAEKLAVMAEFGRDNTRVRDYYDLWVLSRRYSFHGHVLLDAIHQTFAGRDAHRFVQRRDGYWEAAFSEDFVTPKLERSWRNWVDDHAPTARPPELSQVVAAVASFGVPLLNAVREGEALAKRWAPTTGWRSSYGKMLPHRPPEYAVRPSTPYLAVVDGGHPGTEERFPLSR